MRIGSVPTFERRHVLRVVRRHLKVKDNSRVNALIRRTSLGAPDDADVLEWTADQLWDKLSHSDRDTMIAFGVMKDTVKREPE